MLIGQLLNSDATVNNFSYLDTILFAPGEAFTIVMQVQNPKSCCIANLRKMILAFDGNPAHIGIVLNLPNKDGSDLSLTMTQMANDASIWTTSVNSTQSMLLATGNANFTITDSSIGGPGPVIGIIPTALSLQIPCDVV